MSSTEKTCRWSVLTYSAKKPGRFLECRQVLEGLIAARAAARITDDQRVELRSIGEAMKTAVADGELVTYSGLNGRFHALVAEISGQQTAADLIGRLRSQIVRHQFRLAMRPGRPQVSLPQHLAIIDALASGDADRAELAAREHIASVISALTSGTAS